MSHDVFISYSSTDKTVADAICAALEKQQVRCWFAPRDIRPGDSWGGSILDAIEESTVMVVVFSSNANASKQVMREVERAVKKDVVIVPFRIEKVEPSDDLEYFLSATHWLDAVTPEMDRHLSALTATVKSILNTTPVERPPSPAAASPEPPAPRAIKRSKLLPIGAAVLALVIALGVFALLRRSGTPSQAGAKPVATEEGDKVLASDLGTRAEDSIELKAAPSAVAATELLIAWSGESASDDYITIAKADAQDAVYSQRAVVGDGIDLTMVLPDTAGTYEIRYFDAANRAVLARAPLAVTTPEITLDTGSTALAGSEIQVEWTAPNNSRDHLAIAREGSEGRDYLTYSYCAKGSPTTLRVPDEAGQFELRYMSGQTNTVWKALPLEVTLPEVSIAAASEAVAGSEVIVDWNGPANKGDFLAIAAPSMEGEQSLHYTYAKSGTDGRLRMPEEAGQYEIRYVSGQKHDVWATQPIAVTAPEVSISTVPSAAAGTDHAVEWTGPANKRDYISLARPGGEGHEYLSYVYVKPEGEIKIRVPDIPGNYEVRYVSGQENHIWARAPITVTRQTVTIERPIGVKAGKVFEVSWSGPGNRRDYIGVYEQGADPEKYLSYKYTTNQPSLTFKAPEAPGTYELRYISGQEALVWASVEFVVE